MPILENLTETDIKNLSSASNYRQGLQYLKRIHNPKVKDGVILAQVRGHTPYYVKITTEKLDEVSSASKLKVECTCPDSWNKFCKHAVAVLLQWANEPESFAGYDEAGVLLESNDLSEPPPSQPYTEPPGWMQGQVLPLQAEFSRSEELVQLQNWLQKMTLQDIQAMADDCNWHLDARSKSEAVVALSEFLLDEAHINQQMTNQDAEHQQVFHSLSMILPKRSPSLGEHQLERLANLPLRLTSYKRFNTYTRHLREAGLALPGHVDHSAPNKLDLVPPAIARRATARHKSKQVSVVKASDKLTQHQGDSHQFLQDVHQFLLILNQQETPLSSPRSSVSDGGIRYLNSWSYNSSLIKKKFENAKKRASYRMQLPVNAPPLPFEGQILKTFETRIGPPEKIDFIYHLLLELNILQVGSPVQAWSESYNAFVRLKQAQQWALLTQAYFNTTLWTAYWLLLRDDRKLKMLLVPNNDSVPYSGDVLAEFSKMRQAIVYVLTHLPENHWLKYADLEAIFKIVYRQLNILPRDYRFQIQYQSKRERDTFAFDSEVYWEEKVGRFIQTILTGPLHWLGVLDYAINPEDDQLELIRLQGLAQLFYQPHTEPPTLSEQTTAQLTVPAEAFHIRDDGESIGLDVSQAPPQAHLLLQKIAALSDNTAEVQYYQLNLKDFHRSLESGLTGAALQAEWETLMPQAMPALVQEKLQAWEEIYQQLRLYHNVTTLEFAEAYIAKEVKAITSLEEHILAEITPKLVVIPLEAAYKIKEELTAAGYTPSDNLPSWEGA